MRVLVAEDDHSVAAALVSALTRAGHSCVRCERGSEVLELHGDADLVMLDLGLADMDGLEVLQQLRTVSSIPVIVVTARGDERSTVQALRLGADDYIVKPGRLHELLARIAAVARRSGATNESAITIGEVSIDPAAHRVTSAGAEIRLTPTELALLTVLAQRVGHSVSRQEIVDQVWGADYRENSRAFDVHLAQLRAKLPTLTITTLRGVGLRLEATA